MGRLHERLSELCRAFSDAARAEWADQLVAVAVFGSVGRGTPRFDSDCDFLVVLEHCPPDRTRRADMALSLERRMTPLMTALSLEGITPSLSPVLKSRAELLAGFPLLLDMTEDAIILHDPEQVLANRIALVRLRLRTAGARRVWSANAWHWDLKSGEFEL